MDPELFKNHNYEYLNQVLAQTNSYPFEITKTINKFITITMSLKSLEEIAIDDEIFAIPELKPSKNKGHKQLEKMTGNKTMKIKN